MSISDTTGPEEQSESSLVATTTTESPRQYGQSPRWTADVHKKVVKRYRKRGEKAWPIWQKHLRRRTDPLAGSGLASLATDEFLRWGLSEQQVAQLIGRTQHSNGESHHVQRPNEPLNELDDPRDEPRALMYLRRAYELPRLAAKMSEGLWWETLFELQQIAQSAAALDPASHPLVHQWLAGELSLVLAVQFPELAACQELLPQARRALSIGMEELLDGEGLPHGRYIALQSALAACWTRSGMLGESLPDGCWNEDAAAQFPYVVRELLRLARRDGSSIFSTAACGSKLPSATLLFFSKAVELAGGKENRTLLKALCDRSGRANGGRQPAGRPANHSEWAQIAVLRPNCKRSSPHPAITYAGKNPRIELAIGRTKLFSGEWRFECGSGDKQIQAVGEWQETCWVSDDEVDYLEIEMELSEGLRLQRQVCLAREDRFLFVADAVLGSESSPLHHTLHLPLAGGATVEGAGDSREIVLSARKKEAVAFPLALPEWRLDSRGGELATQPDAIELKQATSGGNLYVPLWIDLDASRHRRPFTWRQLTVAEQRDNVSKDEAVGYRVQFGKEQWLVYRSLAKVQNRTILGHNLATEFLIARFGRDGSVKSLIELE